MKYTRWSIALLSLLTACALPNTAITPTAAPAAPPAASVAAQTATDAPAALPNPTSAALPTSAPVAAALDDPQRLAATSAEDRDRIALAKAFEGVRDISATVRTAPLQVNVGDVESFWVTDSINNTNYQISATLRYAGPVALLYVDSQLDVEQAAVEESAREFEERIYPRDRALFGAEDAPGVDGDGRITILSTPLRGAGGYFSSADGLPQAVNRFSNERDMFLIGSPPGVGGFGATLAHEFQHMIHENQQQGSPSWFNEGMSTLAEDLNGYESQGTARLALQNPDIQLTTWSSDAAQTGQHYGTSRLFMRYFSEQYAQEQGLAELIAGDAGNQPSVFAQIATRRRPDITNFADVVADWAVANAINDPAVDGGRYAYRLLPTTVEPQDAPGQANETVSQFGADYLALPKGASLTFAGSTTVSTVGTPPQNGRYAWWSNRGDNRVQTLTRAFDLRGVQRATLQFSLWHELEQDWDYGVASVSADNGATWTTLKGATTTTSDPQGNNVGEGFTGVSGAPGTAPDEGTRGQWIEEQADLSPYVGQQVLVRFWAINDDAYNAAGMMVDNIRIPELNYADDAETGDGGWQAQGFSRITGTLPQTWALRLIRQGGAGTTVERVAVDASGRATVQLAPGETGTFMVMGSTPVTTEAAQYQYTVQ